MDEDFEWDATKASGNLAKHGVRLEFSALLFDGRIRVERLSPKTTDGEPRVETMAVVGDRVLFCVFTWRMGRRRAISLRSAHRSERRAYSQAVEGGRGASRGFRLVEGRRPD